jgi:hypothetical protein
VKRTHEGLACADRSVAVGVEQRVHRELYRVRVVVRAECMRRRTANGRKLVAGRTRQRCRKRCAADLPQRFRGGSANRCGEVVEEWHELRPRDVGRGCGGEAEARGDANRLDLRPKCTCEDRLRPLAERDESVVRHARSDATR